MENEWAKYYIPSKDEIYDTFPPFYGKKELCSESLTYIIFPRGSLKNISIDFL